jgi:hypothetical protein
MKRFQYSITLLLIAGTFTTARASDYSSAWNYVMNNNNYTSQPTAPVTTMPINHGPVQAYSNNAPAMLSDLQRVANIWQVVMPSKSARQPIVSAISNLLQENPYLLQGSLAQVKARGVLDDNLSLLINSSNSAINNALLGTLNYEANTYGASSLTNAVNQIEAILSGNSNSTPTAPLASQLVPLWSGYFGDGAANPHFIQLTGIQTNQATDVLADFQRIYNIWQVVMPSAQARAPYVRAIMNVLKNNPAAFTGTMQQVQARAANDDSLSLQVLTDSGNKAISTSLVGSLNYELNHNQALVAANVDAISAILAGTQTVSTAGQPELASDLQNLWSGFFLQGPGWNRTITQQFRNLANS